MQNIMYNKRKSTKQSIRSTYTARKRNVLLLPAFKKSNNNQPTPNMSTQQPLPTTMGAVTPTVFAAALVSTAKVASTAASTATSTAEAASAGVTGLSKIVMDDEVRLTPELHQLLTQSSPLPKSLAWSTITLSESPLENVDILSHVLSFVGPKQYRFVASINRSFQETYVNIFQNEKRTYLNTTTVKHAQICYREINQYHDNLNLQSALCATAAAQGNLLVLQYLRSQQKRCHWNYRTYYKAAEKGHLHILQWAYEYGCPWFDGIVYVAASDGHLHVLQWAKQIRKCSWDAWSLNGAAENGHLNIIQWARENGGELNKKTCARAAEGGQLHVLKWLRDNGCTWDAKTCANAALLGHLHILQYAHENGCPWDEDTCFNAAMVCRLDILQYARQHGCPWDVGNILSRNKLNANVVTWINNNNNNNTV